MAAGLCNRSRQEREREEREGEVDRAEGDKVKPPDGLNPDRMRQMTCVNGGRYRSESFNGPEQKNKIKILFSLSLSSCSGMFSSVSPDPPFSSSNQKVIFFKQISQGHLNTVPESYTHSVEEKKQKNRKHFLVSF